MPDEQPQEVSMLYTEQQLIERIAQALGNTTDLRMPEGMPVGARPLKPGYVFLGKAPPWLQALYVLEQEIEAKGLVYARSEAQTELELCVQHARVVHETADSLRDVIPTLDGYISITLHPEWELSGIHWQTYRKLHPK